LELLGSSLAFLVGASVLMLVLWVVYVLMITLGVVG
jgi:hypothetical protein